MKIKKANFSIVDMSGAERIKFKKPSEEDLEKFKKGLKEFFVNLPEDVEIENLNITFFDLSDAEDVEELI